MTKVLFICGGNVSRSQIAEGIFNYLAKKHGLEHVAKSAAGYEAGDKIGELNIQVLKEIGVDISPQRPKNLTDELLLWADIIVLVCGAEECRVIRPKAGQRILHWPIPRGILIEERRKIRDDIKARIEKLLKELSI